MWLAAARAAARATQGRIREQGLAAACRGLAANAGGAAAGGAASSGGGDQPTPAAQAAAASSSSSSDEDAGAPLQLVEHTISVDRSGLWNPPPHSHDPAAAAAAAGVEKEPETELARHLKAVIQFGGGPISLAEYMGEALTNPQHGYYTQRDVFGAAGDFVTSPEISQMFGELVGIWCVAAWQQLGRPASLHLVELGPGRGTLMADLLRGTAAFRDFSAALRVSLVEVSPHLRGLQWRALRCAGEPPPGAGMEEPPQHDQAQQQQQQAASGSSIGGQSETPGSSSGGGGGSGGGGMSGVSGWGGARVSWHRSLEEVEPEGGAALYIAHEFLDALPVHQFQRTERGWCERLVDVAAPDSPLHLRMVLSPGATPAARALLPRRLRQLPPERAAALQAVEVCPQAMALAESLARRVAAHGGAALIVDYGQDAPYESSLQAIRRHAFVGLLEQPGAADLSNRVDYSALRASVEESGAAADSLGPIPQAAFLTGLGIEQRLEALLAGATPAQAEALQAGYRRLVGGSEPGAALTEEGMGSSYQAFCIAQRGLQPWPFGTVVVEGSEEEEGCDAGGGGQHGGGSSGDSSSSQPPPPQPRGQ